MIIETGTNYGGLALFLASVLQNLDPNGRVMSLKSSTFIRNLLHLIVT